MTYAEGGTISYANGKRIHTFTDSGTLVVTEAGEVESLVVAGGGAGGGDYAHTGTAFGGGGGGGVIYTSALTVGLGNVAVTVGEGGISATVAAGSITDAQNSSITDGNVNFTTQTAIRGGTSAQNGGSGGGGSGGGSGVGGTGTVGQGNDGGDVTNFFTGAAGGGGAGGAGSNAAAADFTDNAGGGGDGYLSSISGTATRYGAGGGGGAWKEGAGSGGAGGGGNGGWASADGVTSFASGQAGTGYGAGGGGQGGAWGATRTGGSGHAGVVIFSYDSDATTGRRVAQNEDLADMAASTIKGRITSTGIPQDLNASEVAGILAAHFQPLDSDLTSIAGLSPSNDDIIQRKAGAWVNRTVSQLVTDIRAVTDSVYGLQSGTLAQFAATTSLELKGVISDETGSGALVFANTPTLISPVISNFFWANHTHAASGVTGGTLASATGLPLTTGVTGILPAANGGTGVNNSTRTLTISTNGGTIDFSAAASTLTVPESMTAAGRNVANNFTAAQQISIITTGAFVIGSPTALSPIHFETEASTGVFIDTYNSTLTSLPFVQRAARGTKASPSAIASGDIIAGITGRGYHSGGAFATGGKGAFYIAATESWTSTANGTKANINTVAIGATTPIVRSVWDENGMLSNYGIKSASQTGQGIGYATGAGGTVTQATDKTTGVTLNKVTGLITLNNAALAAGTTVTFTLTNSTIEATDTVILNHASAGTAGAYALNVQVAAGSATINVRNVTAGSLSEAIVIRYTVIKSVSA